MSGEVRRVSLLTHALHELRVALDRSGATLRSVNVGGGGIGDCDAHARSTGGTESGDADFE
jgi:hypothetical protein